MRRNIVSVALLAAVSVCGAVQGSAKAQGGVLMEPSPTAAPVVRGVPHVVQTRNNTVRTETPMPVPSARPIAASGRIVHVQNARNLKTDAFQTAPAPTFSVRSPAAFSMGGFSPDMGRPGAFSGMPAPSPTPTPTPTATATPLDKSN